MVKLNKIIPLVAVLALVGCNTTGTSDEPVDSNSTTSDATDTTSDSTFPTTSTDTLIDSKYGIATGAIGSMMDLEGYFSSDTEYNFGFNVMTIQDQTTKMVSSNEDIITVSDGMSVGNYVLECHNPGDAVLSIYDVDDILLYRNIIRVRQKYDEVELLEYMFEQDYYYTGKGYIPMFGDLTMTMVGEDSFALKGQSLNDGYFNNMIFYVTYKNYDASRRVHNYDIYNDDDTSVSNVLLLMQVKETGDIARLYHPTDMLLTFLYAPDFADPTL